MQILNNLQKLQSRAGTCIAHLAQCLIYIYTGLPIKYETSETTVQNVLCMLPLFKIPRSCKLIFFSQADRVVFAVSSFVGNPLVWQSLLFSLAGWDVKINCTQRIIHYSSFMCTNVEQYLLFQNIAIYRVSISIYPHPSIYLYIYLIYEKAFYLCLTINSKIFMKES